MKTTISRLTTLWQTLGRVFSLFWNVNPWFVVIIAACMLVGGIIPSIQLTLTMILVQTAFSAIQHGQTWDMIQQALLWGLVQAGLSIASILVHNLQVYLQTLLQLRLANHVSLEIIHKALDLEMTDFENSEVYDLLQRAQRESDYRLYMLFTQAMETASQGITLISISAVLFTWNWIIGVMIIVAQIPFMIGQIFFAQREYKIEFQRAEDRRRQNYLKTLLTNGRSFKEIRVFGLGEHFYQLYKSYLERFLLVDQGLARRQVLVLLPLSLLSSIVGAGAQLYALVDSILHSSPGQLAGYLQALGLVQRSLQLFLHQLSQLYQNHLFLQNLFDYLNYDVKQIASGKLPMPNPLREGIRFIDVSFTYPNTERPVFEKLNLEIRAGECLALVGENGAGKTTLVKLLLRFYEPTSGYILLDGHPLEDYDLQDLRKQMSVIFQDFLQYELTLRENIGFGALDVMSDTQRIEDVSRDAGISDIIAQLPKGLETQLGRQYEQGQELSLGQWQKVALARALIRRGSFVVLDEPTASIDAASEAELFNRLRILAHGATTLLIAHRFSTVRMADRIVVLEHGRVLEEGTHQELMHQRGTYANLFSMQASGYLDSGLNPGQVPDLHVVVNHIGGLEKAH